MTDQSKSEAARFDRFFLIAFVPLALLFAVAMYVRFTSNPDPLWAELVPPLLFALVGLRIVLRPAAPEFRKTNRWVGILLIVVSAVLAAIVIEHSLGAQ